MAHLTADHLHSHERQHTDPFAVVLFAVLASVVVALALTEQFRQLPIAVVACVAAWVVARIEANTREHD